MAREAHRVGVLVFDDVKMLDVSGPMEVFSEANIYGADYRLSIVSVDGAPVRSSIGVTVPADADAASTGPFDTLLVAGGDRLPGSIDAGLSSAAAMLAGRAHRIASICTGAFILGAAGLLDGKRATTHWRYTTLLARRHTSTRVEPDAIYVKDGRTYSSAGVTAGIDLALALVEEDHGPDLTRNVARSLVVYMQRSGGRHSSPPHSVARHRKHRY